MLVFLNPAAGMQETKMTRHSAEGDKQKAFIPLDDSNAPLYLALCWNPPLSCKPNLRPSSMEVVRHTLVLLVLL